MFPCETTHVSAGFCFSVEKEFELDNISNKKPLSVARKGVCFKEWVELRRGSTKKAINIKAF